MWTNKYALMFQLSKTGFFGPCSNGHRGHEWLVPSVCAERDNYFSALHKNRILAASRMAGTPTDRVPNCAWRLAFFSFDNCVEEDVPLWSLRHDASANISSFPLLEEYCCPPVHLLTYETQIYTLCIWSICRTTDCSLYTCWELASSSIYHIFRRCTLKWWKILVFPRMQCISLMCIPHLVCCVLWLVMTR